MVILIIDESSLFRDYLKERLTEFDITVITAINGLDGISKIRSEIPDLVIIDYHLTRKTCRQVLEEKKKDPNTMPIPVIITANKIDKNRILELLPYNVKKVFSKPIKMDSFYTTLSEILSIELKFDSTECILEAHVNDNIIFIEIARGLNREKIDLLRFKITELIELYEIKRPRVLLMITDIELSFVDGPNVEKLIHVISGFSNAKHSNIKILTKDKFIHDYIQGHKTYSDIDVVQTLQAALDTLLQDIPNDNESTEEVYAERVLSAGSSKAHNEYITTKFDIETAKAFSVTDIEEAGKGLAIAVVDDDIVIRELIKTTFTVLGSQVTTFDNGQDLLSDLNNKTFDLIFLDILMPKMTGFDVLKNLHSRDIEIPIIILSAVTQREAVIKAFQAGVKSYLIKPLKPDHILKKTIEILKTNF